MRRWWPSTRSTTSRWASARSGRTPPGAHARTCAQQEEKLNTTITTTITTTTTYNNNNNNNNNNSNNNNNNSGDGGGGGGGNILVVVVVVVVVVVAVLIAANHYDSLSAPRCILLRSSALQKPTKFVANSAGRGFLFYGNPYCNTPHHISSSIPPPQARGLDGAAQPALQLLHVLHVGQPQRGQQVPPREGLPVRSI